MILLSPLNKPCFAVEFLLPFPVVTFYQYSAATWAHHCQVDRWVGYHGQLHFVLYCFFFLQVSIPLSFGLCFCFLCLFYQVFTIILDNYLYFEYLENDHMEPCARDAFENCYFADYDIHHMNPPRVLDAFMKCEDKKGKHCKADIWKHFIKTVDARKKDLEKNRGKFNEFMPVIGP